MPVPDRASRARGRRAVALRYGPDDGAPVVVASGMGYLAEKIVDVAQSHGVPVYEDDSLATILTQLNLGQEIPPELYQAIVEIYVYFLNFDPARRETMQAPPEKPQPLPETAAPEGETAWGGEGPVPLPDPSAPAGEPESLQEAAPIPEPVSLVPEPEELSPAQPESPPRRQVENGYQFPQF